MDVFDAGTGTSSHVKAPVYVQHLTSDVAGHRRTKKKGGIDDFMSFAQPPQRNLFDEIRGHFVRHTLAHPNIDETGRDCVHRNVLPSKFTGGDFGEGDNSRLA